MNTIVDVHDLSVLYPGEHGLTHAVNHVSFRVHEGESIAIVGESGSGKTTLAMALFNSIIPPGRIAHGDITFFGKHRILTMSQNERQRLLWERISMVFQAAQNSLNPLLRIKRQIEDIAQSHRVDKKRAVKHAAELMETMYLNPARVLNAYPHELSGGMKQRVSIALALLLDPDVIVLDEPTTALDVISQSAVLKILNEIRRERNISLIFITHDISVISQVVDNVMVMYNGRVVESGPVRRIVKNPHHPYARGLISAIPPLLGPLPTGTGLHGQTAPKLADHVGCAFADRCDVRTDRCLSKTPQLIPIPMQGEVACLLYANSQEGASE